MRVTCNWSGNRSFESRVNGFRILMDAGSQDLKSVDAEGEPLHLITFCNQVGRDVINLLESRKSGPERFEIEMETPEKKLHSEQSEMIKLKYFFEGACDPKGLHEAVRASQQKYKSPIPGLKRAYYFSYQILLNGRSLVSGVGRGS